MAFALKLLEEVAQRILDRFFKELRMIKKATFRLQKLIHQSEEMLRKYCIILTKNDNSKKACNT